MSAADLENLARTFFEKVWNQGDISYIYDTIAPDCEAYGLGSTIYKGPDGFRKFYDLFTSALSDIQIDVKDVIATDDKMAVHVEISATHKASGKQ